MTKLINVLSFWQNADNIDDAIKKSSTPVILLGGQNLFEIDVMYVVAEKQVVCDLSKECKLIDALVMLLCTYFVFNFDYIIQRNVIIFFQTIMLPSSKAKIPVSVSQLFTELQEVV